MGGWLSKLAQVVGLADPSGYGRFTVKGDPLLYRLTCAGDQALCGMSLFEDEAKLASQWSELALGTIDRSGVTLLDTTTLSSAADLLLDQGSTLVDAFALLDLDTVLSALVFSEQVVCLENPDRHFVERFGLLQEMFDSGLRRLPVESALEMDDSFAALATEVYPSTAYPPMDQFLSRLYRTASDWANAMLDPDLDASKPGSSALLIEQRSVLTDSWTTILGRPITETAILDHPNNPRVERSIWSSETDTLSSMLRALTSQTGHLDIDLEGGWLRKLTHRSMFNEVLASQLLEISYRPSVARWPMQRFAHSAWSELTGLLAQPLPEHEPFSRFLAEQFSSNPADIVPSRIDRLNIPPVLAVILTKAHRPDQIAEATLYLRTLAEPVRKRTEELRYAVEHGDDREISRIRQALEAETRSLKWLEPWGEAFERFHTVGDALSAAGFVSLCLGLPAPMWAALILAANGARYADGAWRIVDRLRRREYRVFNEIGTTVRELGNDLTAVGDMWRLNPGTVDAVSADLRRLENLRVSW